MQANGDHFLEKLIKAHYSGRKHLLRLLEGLSEKQWMEFPTQAKWNIQRTATHIVNAEIYWMRSVNPGLSSIEYAGKEMTLADFLIWQENVSQLLEEKVRQEYEEKGYVYTPPGNDRPSFQWVLLRTAQHSLYHTGTITYLRQALGAPKLGSSDSFGEMADSVTTLIKPGK